MLFQFDFNTRLAIVHRVTCLFIIIRKIEQLNKIEPHNRLPSAPLLRRVRTLHCALCNAATRNLAMKKKP